MKKLIITIVMLVIAVSVAIAAILSVQGPTETVVTGVVAGNTFTYELKSYVTVNEDNVTLPQGASEYNNTEWYKVTITSVSGPKVSLNTTWHFVNGTEIENTGHVNVLTGEDNKIFWAIYPANLTANQLVSPQGTEGNYVNETETRSYTNGDRVTSIITLQNEFPDASNPTRVYNDYLYIYFDKTTGMLVELKDIQLYNSPEVILTYNWILIGSNVWTV